jgi:uncharacterized protein
MASESREFQIFVKPIGAKCNLSCAYCYYLDREPLSDKVRGGRMSYGILGKYIRQHIEASTENEIIFSWHGGEPCLAGLDFFRKAVEIQKHYLPAGKTILNGIQTNATLITDEWGRFFGKEAFYVGVSLDGPEYYHNINRVRRDHRGTYADVMRGLEIIREHNVPYEFLCVVSNDNVHDPLEIYRFFKELGASFISFLPMVERKGITQEASARSVRPVDFGQFLSVIFDEWLERDIGRVKIQVFEEALRTAFNQEHTLCIFRKECGGVPAVEMNGDFYSCDHYVNDEHLIGNLTETSLTGLLDHPAQKAFGMAKRSTLPKYCLECEVLEMCNGECPKNRFITSPDGESGLNYLCEGYKYFFTHCRPFVSEVARVWRGEV